MKTTIGLSEPSATLHRSLTDLETFTLRYFSTEQTILVETLLSAEEYMDIRDNLHNEAYYTVELSTGKFHGLHTELIEKMAGIDRLLKSMKSGSLQHEILSRDQDTLERASSVRRAVYEWYAVPYWIADYFIHAGEVVLIWQGLCWWGRTETGKFVYQDEVVRRLYSSIETKEYR